MPTLLLSTWTLSAARSLAEAARRAGWSAIAWDDGPDPLPDRRIVYYGGTDIALQAAVKFRLALLEPPLDLLARLPASMLLREVQFARFRDLSRLQGPTFVKPADPLDKCFDAGVYSDARDIRAPRGIDPDAPGACCRARGVPGGVPLLRARRPGGRRVALLEFRPAELARRGIRAARRPCRRGMLSRPARGCWQSDRWRCRRPSSSMWGWWKTAAGRWWSSTRPGAPVCWGPTRPRSWACWSGRARMRTPSRARIVAGWWIGGRMPRQMRSSVNAGRMILSR